MAAVRRKKQRSFNDTKAKSTIISRKRVSTTNGKLRPGRMPFQGNDCSDGRRNQNWRGAVCVLQLTRIQTMLEWKSDNDLFALCTRELYTPVVGDILDDQGFAHQFLPQPIQPLREEMKLAGRAMPVLMIDVFGKQKKPFGLLTEALDQLQPGEIYLASGGEMRCAYWGEILTATAKRRGAVGAVINGFHRDTPKVLEQNWPVFSRGRFAQDSAVRTQVIDYRCPIEIGQASVHPGDLIFGDLDGVVVIPKKVEAEIIERALAKARGEKLVRKEIESGMSSTAAFKKYGIL